MQRYFMIALGLMLVTAVFCYATPAEPTLGRDVSSAAASELVGGSCGKPKSANCSAYTDCGTAAGCLSGGVAKCDIFGTSCNANCSISACSNGSCS